MYVNGQLLAALVIEKNPSAVLLKRVLQPGYLAAIDRYTIKPIFSFVALNFLRGYGVCLRKVVDLFIRGNVFSATKSRSLFIFIQTIPVFMPPLL